MLLLLVLITPCVYSRSAAQQDGSVTHRGTMGNVVQCCHTLLNYLRCKDAAALGEAERSPLLSSKQSECDSPTLTDDLEDDLLTVCTGVTNANFALEREHFLFPDIILSSNLRGDMALVEPMVCLLVSEEDEGGGEGVRMDEPGDEKQERRDRGRRRFYSEVETQTEVETQMRTGVQTQTESQTEAQTQTEILLCNNKTVEREKHAEVNTQTNADAETEMVTTVWADHKIPQRSDAALEAQTGTEKSREIHTENQISTNMSPENQKGKLNAETWFGGEVVEELEMVREEFEQREVSENHDHKESADTSTEHNTVSTQSQDTGLMDEVKMNKDDKTKGSDTKLHQNTVAMVLTAAEVNAEDPRTEHGTLQTENHVEETEQNTERTERGDSVMLTERDVDDTKGNDSAAEQDGMGSQRNTQQTKHNNTETVEDFVGSEYCAEPTQQNNQNNEQTEQRSVRDNDQNTKPISNLSADHICKTATPPQCNEHQTGRDVAQTEGNLGNTEPTHGQEAKSKEKDNVVTDETPAEESETKRTTLFLVDKLFHAAPHIKGA